jgi:hypothetical protein
MDIATQLAPGPDPEQEVGASPLSVQELLDAGDRVVDRLLGVEAPSLGRDGWRWPRRAPGSPAGVAVARGSLDHT